MARATPASFGTGEPEGSSFSRVVMLSSSCLVLCGVVLFMCLCVTFTRYIANTYIVWCMAYERRVGGGRKLRNRRARVLQECGQCR